MEHYIYTIEINNEVVYVGRTKNNLDQREKEHRSAFKRYINNPKRYYKTLYEWLHQNNIKPSEIVLKPANIAKSKVEAKRKEMYLILYFFFNFPGQLKQKVPSISDR